MRRSTFAVIVLGVLVALPVLATPPTSATPAPTSNGSNAVIAVIDGGVNPYHVQFRDDSPRAYQYPGTYIPDYPANAVALNLSLDAPDMQTALERDCHLWENVTSGQLYWIPGTRIVGAVEFFAKPQHCVRDRAGHVVVGDSMIAVPLLGDYHGTMAASRAVAKDYGGCPTCLLVALSGARPASMAWSQANANWIDVESDSWFNEVGVLAICAVACSKPTDAIVTHGDPAVTRLAETDAQAHLVFRASGDGVGNPVAFALYAAPNLNYLAWDITPSMIVVGGEDSGYVATWPGVPAQLASDGCNSWGALFTTVDVSGSRIAGGTSGATPYVAGGAADELKAARAILGDARTGVHDGVVAQGPAGLVPSGPLADGILTLGEWKRVVETTATARPQAEFEDGPTCDTLGTGEAPATPLAWKDLPPGFPEYLYLGYGVVDRPAKALANDVFLGSAPMPERTVTDAYEAGVAAGREALHQQYLHPMI